MRYEEIKDWKEQDFKRLAGGEPATFEKVLAVLYKTGFFPAYFVFHQR